MVLARVEITFGGVGRTHALVDQQPSSLRASWTKVGCACLTTTTVLAEAFQTCTIHALSTEAEEVMGLLLGGIQVREMTWLAPTDLTLLVPRAVVGSAQRICCLHRRVMKQAWSPEFGACFHKSERTGDRCVLASPVRSQMSILACTAGASLHTGHENINSLLLITGSCGS